MSEPTPPRGLRPDPWQDLSGRTPARVALGRAGGSLSTAEVLRFAHDHAEARDAVHAAFDSAGAIATLEQHGHSVLMVRSQAADRQGDQSRATYLRLPHLGRQLQAEDRERLTASAGDGWDVVLIVGDGLSATAANRNGPALIAELLPRVAGLRVGPLVVACQARVGLQDEIGLALGARSAVILLGERPGLGTADSLGAYFVLSPGPGRTDADRNCVSNIRPNGLPLPAAADTLAYLIHQSLARKISGVALKDDRQLPAPESRPALGSG